MSITILAKKKKNIFRQFLELAHLIYFTRFHVSKLPVREHTRVSIDAPLAFLRSERFCD